MKFNYHHYKPTVIEIWKAMTYEQACVERSRCQRKSSKLHKCRKGLLAQMGRQHCPKLDFLQHAAEKVSLAETILRDRVDTLSTAIGNWPTLEEQVTIDQIKADIETKQWQIMDIRKPLRAALEAGDQVTAKTYQRIEHEYQIELERMRKQLALEIKNAGLL